jgi:site-specific DNA-methyltransferase (adenine-specific)
MINTVQNIDCLIGMKDIPDKSIDMILCDLPYGTTSNKWDAVIPFEPLWRQYNRIIKPTGIIALTASQPFSSALVMSNPTMFRHEWIWIKNKGSNFANTVREPFKEHEQVLIFSNGKWTYNKQMQERTGAGLDRVKYKFHLESKTENYREFKGRGEVVMPELRVPSSWQKINTETGLHPTQKPTALMEYMVLTYTNEGETVLDNCMGSGTTAIACINTNRNYIGFEKEEKYFNIIQERIKNHLQGKQYPVETKNIPDGSTKSQQDLFDLL